MRSTSKSVCLSIWLTNIISVLMLIAILALFLVDEKSVAIRQFLGLMLGTVASGCVTLLLLKGQTKLLVQQHEGEEVRKKSVRIYSNKIAAFSVFNQFVWQEDLDYTDPGQTSQIIQRIRTALFGRVLMYLNDTEILIIKEIIKQRRSKQIPEILSSIVDILNNNAKQSLHEGVDNAQINNNANDDGRRSLHNEENHCINVRELWNEFSNWINSLESGGENDPYQKDSQEENVKERAAYTLDNSKYIKTVQPWHFCMYGNEQLDHLEKGNNELSLVEYGQSWRTQRVREVKKGDMVFLFRGNWRYAGVFVAKGWRVFSYSADSDGNRIVVEDVSEGIDKKVVSGEYALINDVQDKLAAHDIYFSYTDDESTSCASIIVEKLSYVPDGVMTPNTTYRKAISRYDRNYAAKLLYVFMQKDPSCRETINNIMPGFLKENDL